MSEFEDQEVSRLPAKANEIFRNLAGRLKGFRLLEGLHGPDSTILFSALFRQSPAPCLWLCLNNRQAEKIAENLRFFLPEGNEDQVLVLPGSEANPYRGLSPHPEIAAKRALALWRLLKKHPGFIITTLASILTRLPSPADFQSHCIPLEVGRFLPLNHLIQGLRDAGYVREDPVSEMGEYSVRGGIVDIFSSAHENPVRIEFFGDQIESMREFDPSTQRSIGLIPSCQVVPMREMILSKREITRWHKEAPEHWNEVRFAEALQEKFQFTEKHELFNGFEYVFPLVVDTEHHLLEFLPGSQDLRVVIPDGQTFLEELDRLSSNQQEAFQEQHAKGELVLPPQRLFFGKKWLEEVLKERQAVFIEQLSDKSHEVCRFDFQVERKYKGRIQDILTDLSRWRDSHERVVFVMSSQGMAERVAHLLEEYGVVSHLVQRGIDEALAHPLSVMQGKLSEGFYSPSLGLHILTQENIFEESQLRVARKPAHPEIAAQFLSDFRDLKKGDYVVHIDHGIGVFCGLERIGVGEEFKEFVVLSYRNSAKLYVPIDRLVLIQKYSGVGGTAPKIDRLGGASWEKTKRHIKKSMRDLAEDLLKLYARREMEKGYAFSTDDSLSKEFEEAFEYEETPDQLAAIQNVKQDMEEERPMDRLICGDVGYGKTEVAMRAAFKAVNDSKQVAFLAPTTVLAFQHYNTFRERCQGFPVSIELLSRFRSRAQLTDVLRRTSLGLVDILIGTHRLLSKDVNFKDLGLIVVDEEQRFGVTQKERLKQLRTKVDVLALSATPIPRSLNMSLIGLRDLSIIETPPRDRLAIQTVVVKFGRNIIRSAIDLELKREGQVFFVHNSVETIYSIATMIQEIMPQARVAVAHGQMREGQLERVMIDFLNYRYDVLVATTIIENGLDISRANTLIVDRSDRFGLAQLYQLRGRVGRSSRRAYAYFMIPSHEILSQDASKRLAAIKEFSELGSGFRIAAMDLEIRGAGNLLGSEQHGHMDSVGFELYTKLLEQAIRELRGEEVREEVQTNIDLRMDIQIPEHYIDDSNLRLWLYKRVSSAPDHSELESLKEEVADRFGKYPNSVSNLFGYAGLRLRAEQLKILSLERKGSRIFLKLREDTPVSREHVIDLVSRNGRLGLTPKGTMSAEIPSTLPDEVFQNVHTLLDEVAVLE